MKKVIRWILPVAASTAIIALIILLLIRFTPEPPIGEVEYAGETLSKAGTNFAATYSRSLFSEAKADFDLAMLNWQRENEKFIFFRDYKKVRSYALLSANKAKQATESSITSNYTLKIKIKDKVYDDEYEYYVRPLDGSIIPDFSKFSVNPDTFSSFILPEKNFFSPI